MSRPGPRLLGLLLAVSALLPARASPLPELRAEFWIDLDAIASAGETLPLSDAEAASRLLEEAAWVYSGLVDGFEFEWVPENKARRVAESFTLRPRGSIQAGDPRLLPGPALRDFDRMRAWIEFRPDEADLRSLEVSRSPSWKTSQGRSGAGLIRGYAGRKEAYSAAIKAGIEAWARANLGLRPRLVRGRVVFAALPSMAIVEGAYTVQARLRIEVLEVRKWEIW